MTVELNINSIKPNTWNPNTMTEGEFTELVAEIKHLGKPPKPIVLRSNHDGYEIVDGEHAYRAMVELGIETLKPGWYEIEQYNDFEAMRQTYKRNQHGTHDPVKQGQLFKRMMTDRQLSGRDLAIEIGVSEGTVRNAVMYADVAERLPEYNFSKLTVRQVRYYLDMPPMISKLWLDSGADLKAAWKMKNTDEFEYQYRQNEKYGWENVGPPNFDKLEDSGLVPFLKSYSNDFAACLSKLESWYKFENTWAYAGITHENLRPYVKYYYQHKWVVRDENLMNNALKFLIDPRTTPASFRLTPEEFDQVINADVGRESSYDFEQRLKLAVMDKCGSETVRDLDWRVRDRLAEKELEAAPEYIRESQLNNDYKFMLWKDYKDIPEEDKRAVAALKRISLETPGQSQHDAIREALSKASRNRDIKQQWTSRTKADISETLSKRICKYMGKPDQAATLHSKFANFTKEELLAMDYYSRDMDKSDEYFKALEYMIAKALGGA